MTHVLESEEAGWTSEVEGPTGYTLLCPPIPSISFGKEEMVLERRAVSLSALPICARYYQALYIDFLI